MSWWFRKVIKAGPIHLNLSKSGVGISLGVRHARLSLSPTRGASLMISGGGFYSRTKVSSSPSHKGSIKAVRNVHGGIKRV